MVDHRKKLILNFLKKIIQVIEIKGQKSIDVKFIDDIRKKIP